MTGLLSRGPRTRRGGRGPGWTLLTTLLILAIVASSALVFTNRVEVLRLAVIIALWAAVVAAFVSVIYRRQSDADRSRARDLKLVYDLQLDREITARREYELTVESQLRRELAAELRSQAADEVAALRGELAALRNNLEILFDTDLGDRPALEHERTTVHAYSDWDRHGAAGTDHRGGAAEEPPDRSGAQDTGRTVENPIIDVSEVPGPAEPTAESWRPVPESRDEYAGQHRSPQRAPADRRSDRPAPLAAEPAASRWTPRPHPPYPTPERAAEHTGWQPTPAEGRWLPPGQPGSNWASEVPPDSRPAPVAEPVSRPRHGRHTAEPADHSAAPPTGRRRRARHSADAAVAEHGDNAAMDTPPHGSPAAPGTGPQSVARHRSPESDGARVADPATGGQSVADLLARLQPTGTGGRRRRRRDEE